MTVVGYRYTIEWYTPYDDPPNGAPRIIAKMYESVERRNLRMAQGEAFIPEWFVKLKRPHYCIHVTAIRKPVEPIPQEKIALIRRKRLKRRMEKKYPLFAEEFYKSEVEKRKEYYDGVTVGEIEQKRQKALAHSKCCI